MEHKICHKTFHHIVNASVTSHLKKYDTTSKVIAEEKVDGSNFYFASDGTTAVYGSKSMILGGEADFYGSRKIVYLKENIKELHQKLNIQNGTIYLYGELIPTQKRIRYIQNGGVYFIAFNLRLISFDIENVEDAPVTWIPKCHWEPLAKECGFIVNPTLFSGSLQECLDYDVENAKSVVPKLIGDDKTILPIEGIVIKGDNFTFKKKATAFREIEVGGGIKMKQKETDVISKEVGLLLGSMLTMSRLDNIISQIGDKIIPDAPRLANTVVLDAIAEAKDDEESVIFKISRTKLAKIQKELVALFTDDVKTHMNW